MEFCDIIASAQSSIVGSDWKSMPFPQFHEAVNYIVSLYLYRIGLESLPPSRILCGKLGSCHRRLLRFALDIRLPTIMTNFDLMNRVKVAGINFISNTIRQRILFLMSRALRAHATTPLCDLLCTNDTPLCVDTKGRSR